MASFFSGRSEDQQGFSSVTPGPLAGDLGNIYLQNIRGLSGAYPGGVSHFAQGFPGLYQPGGTEQNILNSITGLVNQPRYSPEMSQGMGVIQSLLGLSSQGSQGFGGGDWGTFLSRNAIAPDSELDRYLRSNPEQARIGYGWGGPGGSAGGPQAPQGPNVSLETIQQLLQAAMKGPNSLETGGLETLKSRMDPSALVAAAERYMSEIGGPQARAASVAGGMGGVKGGAFQEGLARESARMALPIAQMMLQAQGEYGGAQMGMGGALSNRQTGLATILESIRRGQTAEKAGLAGQLYGMGQGDVRQGQLGLLTAAQGAAAMPRLGGIQDLLRQQQLATSIFGVPVIPGQSSSTRGSSESPMTAKDFLGPLTGIGAAMLMNPKGTKELAGAIGSTVGSGVDYLKGLFSTPTVDSGVTEGWWQDPEVVSTGWGDYL